MIVVTYIAFNEDAKQGPEQMEIFGYDENGELAFRQGPFTFDPEAYQMFEEEKALMVQCKVFHLSLERTYLPQGHRHRVATFASR